MSDTSLPPSAIPSPPQAEGKSFAPRAVAWVIDTVLLILLDYGLGYVAAIVFVLFLVLIGAIVGFTIKIAREDIPAVNLIVGLLLSIAYYAFFEAAYGATPAKLLLQMRVVNYEGRPPSFSRALLRSVWRYIDGLFFGLVAASSMKPPLRQRYGDKRANTIVVTSSSPIITYRPPLSRLLLAFLAYAALSAILQVLGILPLITYAPSR